MEISDHIWTLRRLIAAYDRSGSTTMAEDAHESLDALIIEMARAGLIGPEIDREKDLNDPPAPTTVGIETWTLALLLDGGGVTTAETLDHPDSEASARIFGAWLILRPGAAALIEDKALTPANLERLVRARAHELREMNVGAVEIHEPLNDDDVHVTTVDLGGDGKRSASDSVERA